MAVVAVRVVALGRLRAVVAVVVVPVVAQVPAAVVEMVAGQETFCRLMPVAVHQAPVAHRVQVAVAVETAAAVAAAETAPVLA